MLGFVLIAAVTVALSAVAASRMSVVTMRHIAPAAYVAGGIPAAVAVTAFVRGHANAAAAIGCIAAALCTVTDVATGLIFDEVAALGVIACWCASALPGVQHVTGAVAGAWSGFALLAAVHFATHRRGLGWGDVKLGAVAGAALGAPLVVHAIGVAFVIGALSVLPGLLRRRRRFGERIAFAPYLAVATVLAAIVPSWAA